MSKPEIRLVTNESGIRECRKFWYEIYVREMGRHTDEDPMVNHVTKELRDTNDRSADVFVAMQGGAVVGTLQSAYCRRSELSFYEDLYNLKDRSRTDRAGISVTSKLMIAPALRSSGLAYRLGVATYLKGLRDGIRENYIDTNKHLINFYMRLGYRRHLGWIEHSTYGGVYSMVIDLHDARHLRNTRSPLLKHLEQFQSNYYKTGEKQDEQVA